MAGFMPPRSVHRPEFKVGDRVRIARPGDAGRVASTYYMSQTATPAAIGFDVLSLDGREQTDVMLELR
ncbi:hypothetical protein GOALK_116_00170 [Gordonia alkanivorans NBRC 16433]|uniref:Uncharacterized protein n=1 Tax=Gordonia alkanivorans NBRC 16433 TaxID=1027371 RepID=F9W1L9_9ACTN|nr:hypothetical protein GOALK_116_00170 [Gordonia alkanivorans NBRC 16433]